MTLSTRRLLFSLAQANHNFNQNNHSNNSICLYQIQFYWNYSTYSAWPHNQSHQSSTSHWSLPTLALGRFWYYWSFHLSTSPQIMVQNQQHCFYSESNHISPLNLLLSSLTTSNLLLFSFYMAFLKVLSLVIFFSFFTQLHIATSILGHQSITTCMLMTLSSSFLSLHATSNKTFNSYKTQFLKSHLGWLSTSVLSTPPKLNFYLLVFLHSSLKLINLLYICSQTLPSNLLLLLEILVLSSTQIFPFLIVSK